jgi:hypothetical protein
MIRIAPNRDEACAFCGERSTAACIRCDRPLCKRHADGKVSALCAECEVEDFVTKYKIRKWAGIGALFFLAAYVIVMIVLGRGEAAISRLEAMTVVGFVVFTGIFETWYKYRCRKKQTAAVQAWRERATKPPT